MGPSAFEEGGWARFAQKQNAGRTRRLARKGDGRARRASSLCVRPENGRQALTAAAARPAATALAAISSGVWAQETKPASKAEGAR